ncbi:hypothetical protein HNQ91_003535 [Filimonas zeae]|uniref:PD-(D/E)XK nuclease superfamily protein n=1 Tax=Filimonas zeae TaxID=1737353 RepID=A0A917MX03_9BACT|nr:hypothetical protein [Filimonas zeae]MDR6340470.1 hypothetical protein [Filimonas zeae]GGH72892.1 hypothetical protein GCM10011379_33810 [Filimonas zeae]
MNFFKRECQEPPITDAQFGICDAAGGRAFTKTINPETWTAEVENRQQIPVVFTAIDNCVLQSYELEETGRFDGMLTTNIHLYLVELKERQNSRISKSIQQLTDTINLLKQSHDLSRFRHKKAYAAIKVRSHPNFHIIRHSERQEFFQTYDFRLDLQTRIILD